MIIGLSIVIGSPLAVEDHVLTVSWTEHMDRVLFRCDIHTSIR